MWSGEINIEMRLWFGRRVRQSLEAIRDLEENDPWIRHRLADPEVLEWVAEWYEARIRDFIKTHDSDTFYVDDDEKVKYKAMAVRGRCYDAVDAALEALPGVREGHAQPDLERWFNAALAGKLAWDGPKEQAGYTFVADPRGFVQAQRRRRTAWPRLCRSCEREFKPDRNGLKNCLDCRQEKRLRRCSR